MSLTRLAREVFRLDLEIDEAGGDVLEVALDDDGVLYVHAFKSAGQFSQITMPAYELGES